MAVVIIDTLARGSANDAPFPVIKQGDALIAYLTIVDIAARDAIPEWKRTAGMRVHVLSDGTDYRLGSDVTIAGQVWTDIESSGAFQLTSEKNQAGGYVGLETDGFINPQYIKAIYSNTSYVVATIGERNNLTTTTGDIVVVTDDSQTYVKLNNNPPVNVGTDFTLLSEAGAVLSVNSLIGSVTIGFTSMINQTGSLDAFEDATAITPSVSGNTTQTANNTGDITAIYAILDGLGVATEVAIPVYNSGTTYTDGENVVYGSDQNRNLYRVRDGLGPIIGVIPDGTEAGWEKIGDFYTQAEVDALLLNLTSQPLFNWNRPITKTPTVGDIPGGTRLIDGVEEIYYGRIDTKVELLSIDTLEIGASIAPTINGKVTLGDADNIQQITILDDTDTPVGNPTFTATAEVNEFSFQVDTPIVITAGSALTYKIQVDTIYNVLLAPEVITTTTQTITAVYPFLYGSGATDLNATDKYNALSHLIEIDGNKSISMNANSNKLYFCMPEAYADRVSILDNTGGELLSSLFPDPPVVEQVNSVGLNSDWVQNYKVYQANYNAANTGLIISFIIELEDALNTGPNTLDEILEGVLNKHLTVALRDKLLSFSGADYLTKATYDPSDQGFVSAAHQLKFHVFNSTASTIPKDTILHLQGVGGGGNPAVIIANKDTPVLGSGMALESIAPSGLGDMVIFGGAFGIDTSLQQLNDILYLDSAGGFTFTQPTTGVVQPLGYVILVDVSGVVIINPEPEYAIRDTLVDWQPFVNYKINQVVHTTNLNLTTVVRALDDHTSGADFPTDFAANHWEVVAGDMLAFYYDPQSIDGDAFDMDNMADGIQSVDPNVRKVTITETQRIKLDSLEPASFKGVYATPTSLRVNNDNSTGLLKNGDSANVTSTSTTWIWDDAATPTPPTVGGDWIDTGVATGGDMLASIYDNGGKAVNIYNVDNHDNGTTNKVFTTVEQTKLAGIEDGATADQTAVEIKSAYESNADTNVHSDAQVVKLAGIEDAATADQLAADVPYTPLSPLVATDVQAGLDEIKTDNEAEKGLVMYKSVYDPNDLGVVNNAEHIVTHAINDEPGNILAGDIVYIDSTDVTNRKAKLSSNNDALTLPITGIVLNDGVKVIFLPSDPMLIGINGIFRIPTFQGFTTGDSLYLNLGGKMTTVFPTIETGTTAILVAYVSGAVSGDLFVEMLNLQNFDADVIAFDPSTSTLTEKNVQTALVELSTLAGDMTKAVYDPLGANADAFDMEQMIAGATNLILIQADRDAIALNTAKVSADGSVTTHNDVTDAGSGLIITDVERTKLDGLDPAGEANKALVMGTLYYNNAGGAAEVVGEMTQPTTLSTTNSNVSSITGGRLRADVACIATITISVGAEITNNNAQIELSVNGVLQGIRSAIGSGGNQETQAGMTVTHTVTLGVNDYVSAFLQTNPITVFGMQITINGTAT